MRNWNYGAYFKSDTFMLWLPDYLWGIETLRRWEMPIQRKRFQTTYEELKLAHRRRHKVDLKLASRLPMRNWNRVFGCDWDCVFCFQTTYEELKLSRCLWCFFKCIGFQTTYEELKLRHKTVNFGINICGFQTTYEELKRLSSDGNASA